MFINTANSAINSPEQPVVSKSVTIIKNDFAGNNRYTIQPGDIISVTVYGEPDLAQPEIVVRPDGYATIDPVGEVYVEGFDIQSLTKELSGKFANYINEPIISLNIKEINPPSVYIFGAVQKPGNYQQMTQVSKYFADSKNPIVRTDFSLTNVIANAGGLANDADISNITVTSADKKEKKVNLWRFLKDGDVSQNLRMRTGDVISVPALKSSLINPDFKAGTDMRTGDVISVPALKSGLINDDDYKLLARTSLAPESFPVRVVGEVQRGGTFNLTGESPYLNTVIANASGYTIEGNKSVVVVYRKAANDKLARIFVNPFKQDFVLRPNDVVEVRKRTLSKFVYGADYIVKLLTPGLTIPSIGNSWADLVDPHRRTYRY